MCSTRKFICKQMSWQRSSKMFPTPAFQIGSYWQKWCLVGNRHSAVCPSGNLPAVPREVTMAVGRSTTWWKKSFQGFLCSHLTWQRLTWDLRLDIILIWIIGSSSLHNSLHKSLILAWDDSSHWKLLKVRVFGHCSYQNSNLCAICFELPVGFGQQHLSRNEC